MSQFGSEYGGWSFCLCVFETWGRKRRGGKERITEPKEKSGSKRKKEGARGCPFKDSSAFRTAEVCISAPLILL